MRYLYSVILVVLFSASPVFAAGIGASGEWQLLGKEGELLLFIDETTGQMGAAEHMRSYKVNKSGDNWMVIVIQDETGSLAVIKVTKKSEDLLVLEQGDQAYWARRKGADLDRPLDALTGRWTGFLDEGDKFMTVDYNTQNLILFDEDDYAKHAFAVMKREGNWEYVLTSDSEWYAASRLAGGFLRVCELGGDTGTEPDLSTCAILEPAATATTGMDR